MKIQPPQRQWGRRLIAAVILLGLSIARPLNAASKQPEVRWKLRLDDWVLALAVGRDGAIYAGTGTSGSVYVIGPDGLVKRKIDSGCHGILALAVSGDGWIYARCQNDDLYALDASGIVRWKSGAGPTVQTPDGAISTISKTLDIETIGESGSISKKVRSPVPNVTAIAVGNAGEIYLGVNGRYGLYALAPEEGTVKWKASTGTATALAAGAEGVIYVGSLGHLGLKRGVAVYAIDPKNGRSNWVSHAPKGRIFAIKDSNDGVVYVGSYDGNLYALESKDGSLSWRFQTGDAGWGKSPVHALALDKAGIIYVGAGDFVEAISRP